MPFAQIPLINANVNYDHQWLDEVSADALFQQLQHQISWSVHRIRIFGKLVDSPRLSYWIGDPGTEYLYSGTKFAPQPWPAVLDVLRQKLQIDLKLPFNSVLANLYRDGGDAMGWHSDDERELGRQPVIASLSLGATRRFCFKHRYDPNNKLSLDLAHGSLLVMGGDTQTQYRHALPRTRKPIGARINLTFRQIISR